MWMSFLKHLDQTCLPQKPSCSPALLQNAIVFLGLPSRQIRPPTTPFAIHLIIHQWWHARHSKCSSAMHWEVWAAVWMRTSRWSDWKTSIRCRWRGYHWLQQQSTNTLYSQTQPWSETVRACEYQSILPGNVGWAIQLERANTKAIGRAVAGTVCVLWGAPDERFSTYHQLNCKSHWCWEGIAVWKWSFEDIG